MPAQTPLPSPLDALDDRYACAVVPTAAGDLAVGTWHGEGVPVLALHGISSNHLLWSWAAAAAPEVHLIAPDLRGRGRSTTDGPYGLARHRDDVLALMDALELDRVVLAGMSMGGFVTTAVASAAPDRITSVLLVDGGLPIVPPDDLAVLERELATRGAVEQRFADVDAYTATYLSALGPDLAHDDPIMRAFMSWNLVAQPDGGLTVRLPAEALATDRADVFSDALTAAWLRGVTAPIHLLHVVQTASMFDVAGWDAALPDLRCEPVAGTDHASIVMGAAGGAVVGRALREQVARTAAVTT